MEISNEQLDEFMRLYKARFGKPIERKDAVIQAEKLLQLVRLLRRKSLEEISTRQGGQ